MRLDILEFVYRRAISMDRLIEEFGEEAEDEIWELYLEGKLAQNIHGDFLVTFKGSDELGEAGRLDDIDR